VAPAPGDRLATGAQKSGDTHMNESDNTNDKDAGIAPFERLISDAMT
jgi:hypothetical protein